MVTFPPLRSTNISLVCVPMDKQTYLLTCGSFETCAHRNGRSIKAKHKTFAKMAKKDFLKKGKNFHYLVGHSGIIVLHDEASTVLLRCKTKKELYCSAQAKFYLLYGDELHPIKACMHGPNWRHTGGCGNYAFIRQVHGNVHKLMEVWLDEAQEGETEIDHINGVSTDNRAYNLQHVTPKENAKRRVILRARIMVARQDNDPSKLPENMRSEDLLALFSAYNVAGDVYEE